MVEIGAELGISDVSVGKMVRSMGLHATAIQTQRRRQGDSARKLADADIADMVQLSSDGYGIDWIGKKLGIDGTTVRWHLIRRLGRQRYVELHSVARYRGGPKGYAVNSRGDRIQSQHEEAVADYLYNAGHIYDMHVSLIWKGKRYYPDFYLPERRCYLEVAGMMHLDVYRNRVEVKKQAYAEMGVDCRWLMGPDFVAEAAEALR